MAMLQPVDVSNEIVASIRSIPNIGDHFDQDLDRIFSYETAYPGVNLDRAIAEMSQPGLMVAWLSHRYQRVQGRTAWVWGINLYLRISEQVSGSDLKGYGGLWVAVMDGIPTVTTTPGISFRFGQFNTRILPALTLGVSRETLLLTRDVSLDYYVIAMTFQQTGEE